MKKLILIAAVLLLATTAFGSPYLVTDPATNVESYAITGGITASPAAQADGSLRYDLASLPECTTRDKDSKRKGSIDGYTV